MIIIGILSVHPVAKFNDYFLKDERSLAKRDLLSFLLRILYALLF